MVAVPRLLRSWFRCLLAAVQLAVLFARADRYFKEHGLRDLALSAEQQAQLDSRRHRHYFFGAVFLGAVFGAIRGRALSPTELRRFSTLAALACFFDDLTEGGPDWGLPGDILEYGRRADPSGLALVFLGKTRVALSPVHTAGFEESVHRVFQIETEGIQKQAQHPGETEIARLTAVKGGHSVLLFRFLLAEPLAGQERRALLAFGHLVQLSDDIFDLWHDHRRGTTTMATICAANNTLGTLARHFEGQVEQVFRTFRPIPIQDHRRENALHTVRFLVASTRVCLRHYRHLEKKYGKLPLDDRRLLVADMGKWRLRLRVIGEVAIPRFS